MDYYDGNTVTGLWNYAQNFAMSDNSYDTNFGPSTPGALNVISGSDGDGYAVSPSTASRSPTPARSARRTAGAWAPSSATSTRVRRLLRRQPHLDHPVGVMTGQNVGDLLNARHVTWGWFQGGFAPTSANGDGYAVCGSSAHEHRRRHGGGLLPHHDPFQYYQVHRQPQAPAADLGGRDRPHRPGQPPVRPVRLLHHAPRREHAGGELTSRQPRTRTGTRVTPIRPMSSTSWSARSTGSSSRNTGESTAIVVTYDDSDGWYDHQNSPRVNGSSTAADAAVCTGAPVRLGDTPDRCGYGPRLPLLVISPWTRSSELRQPQRDRPVLGGEVCSAERWPARSSATSST